MSKLIRLLLLTLVIASLPAYSQEQASSVEDGTGGVLQDPDASKGHGRPENPGEHGRQNAAEKQSRGQGNGSKKVDSPTAVKPDGTEDDDNVKSEKNEKDKKDKKSKKQKKTKEQ